MFVFVPPGGEPAAADAEDGELGSQVVPQAAVWRLHRESGEARQQEGSAGGMKMLNTSFTFHSFLRCSDCKCSAFSSLWQTCLKRIRLDMPLTHEDFMGKR